MRNLILLLFLCSCAKDNVQPTTTPTTQATSNEYIINWIGQSETHLTIDGVKSLPKYTESQKKITLTSGQTVNISIYSGIYSSTGTIYSSQDVSLTDSKGFKVAQDRGAKVCKLTYTQP